MATFSIYRTCLFKTTAYRVVLITIWMPAFLMSSFMMTSSNGDIFRITGHLCGEFTGPRWIPRTKASDGELWCFFLICVWINGWVNNREAADFRRYGAHYDVIVMCNPRPDAAQSHHPLPFIVFLKSTWVPCVVLIVPYTQVFFFWRKPYIGAFRFFLVNCCHSTNYLQLLLSIATLQPKHAKYVFRICIFVFMTC